MCFSGRRVVGAGPPCYPKVHGSSPGSSGKVKSRKGTGAAGVGPPEDSSGRPPLICQPYFFIS